MHFPMSDRKVLSASLALLLALALPACKLSVDKNEQNGEKKVEITTPFGGINVNKTLDPKDTAWRCIREPCCSPATTRARAQTSPSMPGASG